MVTITRMEPTDKGLNFEYCHDSKNTLLMTIRSISPYTPVIEKKLENKNGKMTIGDLENNKDYYISLSLHDDFGRITEPTCTRLFTPFKNKKNYKIINYIHKNDFYYYPSGRSTCSPSIIKLENGQYICSHDVYWGHASQNLTIVLKSEDKGITWDYQSQISPCFWGSLFVHKNILYILGATTEYGDIVIHKSNDYGKTWSESTILFTKRKDEEQGYHKAPMPVITSNNRLWTSIEHGTWKHKFSTHIVSADIDSDLMNKNSWTITDPLNIHKDAKGIIAKEDPVCIEGNSIKGFDNKIYNLLRCNLTENRCAVLCQADADNPSAPLKYIEAVDLPISHSKFVVRNGNDGYYYAMGNRIDNRCKNQRQILSMYKSKNLIDWHFCEDILDLLSTADRKKAAMQYPDWFIDENDIVCVSRTAMNKPQNFHNANNITFHRIKDFFK